MRKTSPLILTSIRMSKLLISQYWSYGLYDDGRINKLIIGGPLSEDNNDLFDFQWAYNLPACIVHLERIKDLTIIGGCQSLPAKELSNLPHLHSLRFIRCCSIFVRGNFLVSMDLTKLKTLQVCDACFYANDNL
jgi:hypothetical protein